MVLVVRAAAAFLLCAAACLPRPAVVRAPERAGVALAFVLDGEHGGAAADVPAALRARVREMLAERNLEPHELPFASYAGAFGPVRDTERRLARLKGGPEPLLLLVETRAVFFSQLSGRYRWMIYAKLTAAASDGSVAPLTVAMDQSAFVDFQHEREAEALEAASGAIADRAGALMDDFLGSYRPAAPPPAASAQGGGAVYFVLVDRFANGDPRNDGAVDLADPAAFHGGDLQGVMDHIDALSDLGVDTVWLSPVFQMRTEKFFGHGAFHGYWVQDLGAIEPRFGDPALLRKLSEELHRRGMRLLLDMVVNHVAPDAPLTRERPEWFHARGPLQDWNNPQELETHDVHGLPDLAVEKPEVFAHLAGAALHWIDVVRPDGLRLDAVKHVPLSFWSRYNEELRRRASPRFLLLGELLDGDASLLARAQRQGRFGAMFDFPLQFALVEVFCKDAPARRLGTILSLDRLYDDPQSLVTLLDNHDLPRVASVCGGDLDRVRRALAFQLTARGTPALTYGVEAGLAGAEEPANRGDMRFGEQPLRAEIARWLRLRREHPALHRGAVQLLAADRDLFAYARIAPEEAVLVAVNQGTAAARIAVPAELAGRVTDALSGATLDAGALEVEARSVRVALIAPAAPGGFAAAAARAERQWKTGERARLVEFAATGLPAGAHGLVVGSAPELGSWRPGSGAGPLDSAGVVRARLPVDTVQELKLVAVGADGATEWEAGENRALFVREGEGPLRVDLAWGATSPLPALPPKGGG